jgi:hypothetical protein
MVMPSQAGSSAYPQARLICEAGLFDQPHIKSRTGRTILISDKRILSLLGTRAILAAPVEAESRNQNRT